LPISPATARPSDTDHQTQLNFSYKLDFVDPNHDSYWNRFQSQVTDLTTGRILASESRNGFSPALYFRGTKGYTDTHIRVSMVSLTTLR